jgi:hypothetical protein
VICLLVAPGAISPVSADPSFSTTRCVTESLFLNTTACPPNIDGFGENACVPFCPAIVIVATFVEPVGAVGLLAVVEPPLSLPHATLNIAIVSAVAAR